MTDKECEVLAAALARHALLMRAIEAQDFGDALGAKVELANVRLDAACQALAMERSGG